jgi:hypothetical protein
MVVQSGSACPLCALPFYAAPFQHANDALHAVCRTRSLVRTMGRRVAVGGALRQQAQELREETRHLLVDVKASAASSAWPVIVLTLWRDGTRATTGSRPRRELVERRGGRSTWKSSPV